MNSDTLDNELRNIANDIYKELGYGHRECVYHRAFELELRMRAIPYECEVVVPLFYKGHFLSHVRIDLLVNKNTIIELKAIKSIKDDELNQLKRYLESTGIKNGYVMNFGNSTCVEWKKMSI